MDGFIFSSIFLIVVISCRFMVSVIVGLVWLRRFVVSILQFIKQVLRIDALELAVLHPAQLSESMVNLGECLFMNVNVDCYLQAKRANSSERQYSFCSIYSKTKNGCPKCPFKVNWLHIK